MVYGLWCKVYGVVGGEVSGIRERVRNFMGDILPVIYFPTILSAFL